MTYAQGGVPPRWDPQYIPQSRPAGSGMRKTGKILMIIGVPLFLIGLIGAIALGINTFGDMRKVIDEAQHFESSSITVQLDDGDTRDIYAMMPVSGVGDSDREPAVSASCTVVRPSGQEDTLSAPIASSWSLSLDGEHWELVRTLSAFESGPHTVHCTGAQEYAIGDPNDTIGFIGKIFGTVGLGLLAGLGATLAIVGLILWLIGRSRQNAVPQFPGGPYGPHGHPAPGGYPPPPPAQYGPGHYGSHRYGPGQYGSGTSGSTQAGATDDK